MTEEHVPVYVALAVLLALKHQMRVKVIHLLYSR